MLLTPQGGPRCFAPTAHQIPVYLMVFSTFLCRAFTAHYLYTLRCYHIPPVCFTAQLVLEPASDALPIGHPGFLRDVIGKVAEPLSRRKDPQALALPCSVQ